MSHGIQLRQCEAKHCGQLERLRCFGYDRRVVLGDTLSDLLRRALACPLAMESAIRHDDVVTSVATVRLENILIDHR